MFIVFLKFSEHRDRAKDFMASHKAWVKQGIDDGVFLLVGSLKGNQGGCIVASGDDHSALETRVHQDPFVIEKVVQPEIQEFTPSMSTESLSFLINED
ncbi:YciI family protein [Pseudoteredinibacter isoporae]|uniref:Uncharacterized protein YciI n=1 Tax=Pseudoteredinibacter isoporae TaxID=570281 RepID=A0A7X0JTT1_9GAMM|nr:hypothetical protein [Pseudoteredinibacter isoporae]MBB6522129.1 uncharacterized protein YciI [Pseudoteredinibacter isoporae]NHO87664.1 hypothetical protein [Pseudoteredinibacter isoporae]NIB24005.1 hypothetical protein [Pseudoteredinibacter isoporae]